MPANESVWRNLRWMHVIFAVSSVALLVCTVWMMAADYVHDWRYYQREAYRLQAERMRQKKAAVETPEQKQSVEQLKAELDKLNAELAEHAATIEKQQAAVKQAEADYNAIMRTVRDQRAIRDVRRADYDLAVRDALPADELGKRRREYEEIQARVEDLERQADELKLLVQSKKVELNATTAARDEADKRLEQSEAEAERLHAAIAKIQPEDTLAKIKRKIMLWPIINGFNSPEKIQQDWLPNLTINYGGMREVARFDRCRTCHLMIDQVDTGNVPAFPADKYEQPFSTHPNPDLYLTSASPHPLTKFGCTVCHEGQGSGTTFSNASHTPNDPHQSEEWEHEHHFHANHFWELPMLPERFEESTCIKCHHNVVELGVNPKFGPTAPKVYEGYELVRTYGCFGCHEINGFDAGRSIGPDLRLEPNYAAVAREILTDPKLQAASESGESSFAEVARLADKVASDQDDNDARARLRDLIQSDRQSAQPSLSPRTYALATALKDEDSPGAFRKVGPSLRHIGSKTDRGWLEYWTEEPKRFRPTTRMPQFFHLTNLQDTTASEFQPVELASIAQYLLDKSQSLNLMRPREGYQPNRERGKELFSQRGCLACHSHEDFPRTTASFGPELSRVSEKIRGGEEGFNWVYTWVRDPERHHPRTKMPNVFLEPDGQGENYIDPAADIAAYLLRLDGAPADFQPTRQFRPIELHPYLGIEFVNLAPAIARELGLENASGVRVTAVMDGGPADRATETGEAGGKQTEVASSVRPEDILLEFNGTTIDNAATLQRLIAESKVGERIALLIRRGGQTLTLNVAMDEPLNDLVRLYLRKVLTASQVEKFMESGTYPVAADRVRGDEAELIASDSDFTRRKLNYIGRRTISRYGCYGCHDIPGYEDARPIGTALQDWGLKDTSRLAFEHIEEFLHHHGEPRLGAEFAPVTEQNAAELKLDAPRGVLVTAVNQDSPATRAIAAVDGKGVRDSLRQGDVVLSYDQVPMNSPERLNYLIGLTVPGADVPMVIWRDGEERRLYVRLDGSTRDRVEEALGHASRDDFASEEERAQGLSAAFFYESVTHHGRPGFIWQKLRAPRSYDYHKTETKGYDERLRMPKFPFNEQQIESIATFVLGLVARPPMEQYVYQPTGPAGDRLAGEKLVNKFNCVGCHMVELPRVDFAVDPEELAASDTGNEYPDALKLLMSLKPPRNALTGETKTVKQEDTTKTLPVARFHGLVAGLPDPAEDPEFQEYAFDLWETLDVNGKTLVPGSRMLVPASRLVENRPARGGMFAEWLVDQLMQVRTNGSRPLAWQMSPPPLYLEGMKVQTPWLYNFLRNPERIRHTTVLRMPRFNMSSREARQLANYFAASDGTPYPYQPIPQREPEYLAAKNAVFHRQSGSSDSDYLQDAWKLLNAPLCIKCHSVGGRRVQSTGAPTDIRGPNLDLAADRLRPDWLLLWLYKPQWITPYTSMPVPFPPPPPGGQSQFPQLFGGNGNRQTIAVRDALMNYHRLMEQEGKTTYDPQQVAEAGAQPNNPPNNQQGGNRPSPAANQEKRQQ